MIGAPWPFIAFGVLGTLLALVMFVHHLHDAAARRRTSVLDILPTHAEPDPLGPAPTVLSCTACGGALAASHRFRPGCGTRRAG